MEGRRRLGFSGRQEFTQSKRPGSEISDAGPYIFAFEKRVKMGLCGGLFLLGVLWGILAIWAFAQKSEVWGLVSLVPVVVCAILFGFCVKGWGEG